MKNFSSVDQRADFWKLRIVRQFAGAPKVYLFPSLLEWLNERPQLVLNAALVKRELQLSVEVPEHVEASERRCTGHANGDPLTLFIGGYTNSKPSSKDIVNYLQRSYTELYQRHGQNRSRELVSLIDASLLLNEASFARKITDENKYEHDLLQLHRNQSGSDKWDNYKTSVMLRLSSGGVPSTELLEAATVTRLMCDIMAGPTARRRSAVAEMAANGLKLDAMVLAKLYFSDEEICEQLTRECSTLFQNSINADVCEIVELIKNAMTPIFQRRMLRCIDQLSCYRILRVDFALNEYATLKKKLIGRLELAQHVRYVIADALAYRNFGAVNFIAENAAAHLDKYSFFSGLEQIVYPMAMTLLSEATRMIFHAKPASMGWKKQSDESDKLGSALQQHPNGYIGGLIEMWLKRVSLIEVADSKDVYRQRSLHSSIESIRGVLREDTTFNSICRGLLVFACDLVCSVLEAIFGRPCQRIDELIENPYIDHHTGMSLVRKLTKGMLSSHADERVLSILNQLCAFSIMDAPDASSHSNADYKVPPCSRRVLEDNSAIENIMDFEFAKIPSSLAEPACSHTAKGDAVNRSGDGSAKTSGAEKRLGEGVFGDTSLELPFEVTSAHNGSPSEPDVCAPDSEVLAVSERSSDHNDVSSVAPSRSVCEQVETMMAGVKYCREREHGTAGVDGKQHGKQHDAQLDPNEHDVPTAEVVDAPSTESLVLEEGFEDPSKQNDLQTDDISSAVFQSRLHSECNQQISREGAHDAELENKLAPETLDEVTDETECAKIISDDHLDFSSSQNPSVRTKWLSSDSFPKGDNSDDPAKMTLDSSVSKTTDFQNIAREVTCGGNDGKDLPWEDESAQSREETSMRDCSWNLGGETSSCVNTEQRTMGEELRELPFVASGITVIAQQDRSSSLASQRQDFEDAVDNGKAGDDVGRKNAAVEFNQDLGANRVQGDSPRIVSPGKAMLNKILAECSGPAIPSTLGATKLEKCDVSSDMTKSSSGFNDSSNPFTSTRGMVLCTSLESDPDFSSTSTDDDIAAVFSHSSDTKMLGIKKKVTADEKEQMRSKAALVAENGSVAFESPGTVLPAAPLNTTVAETATESIAETLPSQRESMRCELNTSTENEAGSITGRIPLAKGSSVKQGSSFDRDVTSTQRPECDTDDPDMPTRDAYQKARGDFEECCDIKHKSSVLEPIQEQVAMEGSDMEDARVTVQKKFLSGGFDSVASSCFGSFGGGSEKENASSVGSQSYGERRDAFEAERASGFGGGRSGTRGSGRAGGRGFDRETPRDGYRDRDGREGFRGRGGYGGGTMRDSRSFEGRGGFRGNRP